MTKGIGAPAALGQEIQEWRLGSREARQPCPGLGCFADHVPKQRYSAVTLPVAAHSTPLIKSCL